MYFLPVDSCCGASMYQQMGFLCSTAILRCVGGIVFSRFRDTLCWALGVGKLVSKQRDRFDAAVAKLLSKHPCTKKAEFSRIMNRTTPLSELTFSPRCGVPGSSAGSVSELLVQGCLLLHL